jgi:hypothetical protein
MGEPSKWTNQWKIIISGTSVRLGYISDLMTGSAPILHVVAWECVYNVNILPLLIQMHAFEYVAVVWLASGNVSAILMPLFFSSVNACDIHTVVCFLQNATSVNVTHPVPYIRYDQSVERRCSVAGTPI